MTKRQGVGVFEGDVPLPRVFSFLSFMLMASDAPSGICEGREEEEERGREEGREERRERTEGTGSGVSWGALEQHH